jgi:hypothetical protein
LWQRVDEHFEREPVNQDQFGVREYELSRIAKVD